MTIPYGINTICYRLQRARWTYAGQGLTRFCEVVDEYSDEDSDEYDDDLVELLLASTPMLLHRSLASSAVVDLTAGSDSIPGATAYHGVTRPDPAVSLTKNVDSVAPCVPRSIFSPSLIELAEASPSVIASPTRQPPATFAGMPRSIFSPSLINLTKATASTTSPSHLLTTVAAKPALTAGVPRSMFLLRLSTGQKLPLWRLYLVDLYQHLH